MMVVAACEKKAEPPPPEPLSWWEPQRASIAARWKQIDSVAAQTWHGAPVADPIPCVPYQSDALSGTVAVLYNADVVGTRKAFPMTSISESDDKATACLYLAKHISENTMSTMNSEADQRACIAWFNKLDTIVVASKDDDFSGQAVAVELAGRRVRFRTPISTDAMLAGRVITAEGSGINELAAQQAAQAAAERHAGRLRDSAFQKMTLQAIACK
jgi:hypothetical protein